MKISPQLDNIELFQLITKKHIFESKKTIVLKHTILHVPCVDLLTWSPIKLDLVFYDFFVIYYDFFKISAKINKKNKRQNHLRKPLMTGEGGNMNYFESL